MSYADFDRRVLCGALLVISLLTTVSSSPARERDLASPYMANVTVLIVRHAEKPGEGAELSPAGDARAVAYARYFNPFTAGTAPFIPDTLIASRETLRSDRPQLTLKPLGTALGLPIDTRFASGDVEALADELRANPHGKRILIAWHHGHIPKLILALGGEPDVILQRDHWPRQVYDWVVELRYDANGRLMAARRIAEDLPINVK
ncbi:MAG: flagellar basal body-associated protein FliL [Hyphomicrobiales bacterium]